MASKSKKNRRSLSQNTAAVSANPVAVQNMTASVNTSAKVSSSYKSPANADINQINFLSEIKWIGLVAALIIIILIISYVILV